MLSISYSGVGQAPAVRVFLQRGGGLISLIFQGRSTLEALEIGQVVHVSGALVMSDGMPTIYNPNYTIRGYGQ